MMKLYNMLKSVIENALAQNCNRTRRKLFWAYDRLRSWAIGNSGICVVLGQQKASTKSH